MKEVKVLTFRLLGGRSIERFSSHGKGENSDDVYCSDYPSVDAALKEYLRNGYRITYSYPVRTAYDRMIAFVLERDAKEVPSGGTSPDGATE